jgi:mutual gliding-motility protein MglA
MASVNPLSRELVLKIVYYGPGLGGKTTTLEYLHESAKPEHRGKLVSLATPVDRTLYFDFLPLRVPTKTDLSVRLQLFTVPGQVYFNATRKLVLTGADGVVFVSDAQSQRADANLESIENLRENLAEQGRDVDRLPLVFQHNKQDLPDLVPIAELDRSLNTFGAPSFPTSAIRGVGIYEALDKICELVLRDFETSLPDRSESQAGRSLTTDLQPIEGGLAAALKSASSRGPVARKPPAAPPLTSPPRWSTIPPSSVRSLSESAPGSSTAPLESANGESDVEVVSFPSAPPPPDLVPMSEASRVSASTSAPSFSELWPDVERSTVRAVEAAIHGGEHARAIELCDALVSRTLASAAGLFGTAEAPRDVASVALLLGLDGRRYLRFRATVRTARSGERTGRLDSLSALAFAIDARLARLSIA